MGALQAGGRGRNSADVEDLLHERGVEISHETVRFWWHRFGPMFFGAEIRKRRVEGLRSSHWRWHLDEIVMKINGARHDLWRAVDLEGEASRASSPGSGS